jgi:hypothetical protein
MADFDAALTNPAYKHQKNVRLDYVDIAKDPARACEFLKRLCIMPTNANELRGPIHCGDEHVQQHKFFAGSA